MLLEDASKFESFEKQDVVVVYVTPEGDQKSIDTFLGLADQYDSVPFYHSHSSDWSKHLTLEGNYSLIVLRKFDEGHKVLNSEELLPLKKMK